MAKASTKPSEQPAHTPGPWLIAGATNVFARGERGANICSVSEPRATTDVKYTELELGSPDCYEAYANARLIAAAPDLLEALAALLKAHDGIYRSDSAASLARAAIAKATAA